MGAYREKVYLAQLWKLKVQDRVSISSVSNENFMVSMCESKELTLLPNGKCRKSEKLGSHSLFWGHISNWPQDLPLEPTSQLLFSKDQAPNQ